MVSKHGNADRLEFHVAETIPAEEELRAEFMRQHEGRNLKRNKLRGTYRRADIAALWIQHCRTAKWMAIRSTPSGAPEAGAKNVDWERLAFERQMREEGVNDFTRRDSGRYENMVLEWYWLGWRARAKAET